MKTNISSKIKNFLIKEYRIPINCEKLDNFLKDLYDDNGNIKNKKKYIFFNNMFVMMFGIDFKSIVNIVNKEKGENHVLKHNLLINEFTSKIEMQDREISLLKEVIDELRSNYWNLKQKI